MLNLKNLLANHVPLAPNTRQRSATYVLTGEGRFELALFLAVGSVEIVEHYRIFSPNKAQ